MTILETVKIQSANTSNKKKPKPKAKPQEQNIPDLPHEWDNQKQTTGGEYQDNTGGFDMNQTDISPPNPTKQTIPKPNSSIHIPSMITVKGGTFTMGNDADKAKDNPTHQVAVSDFSIGKYEITNKEYLNFLNESSTNLPKVREWISNKIDTRKINFINKKWEITKGFENHPAIGITWEGAEAYCNWLSKKTGKNYRLPTEAEWEFAARGGNKAGENYEYSGSNNLSEVAWYKENSKDTYSVGRKKANALGIYDMSGNVWEWCSDWYEKDYYKRQVKGGIINPKGDDRGIFKVARGGSFNENENKCAVSYRAFYLGTIQNKDFGFRVVLQ